MEEVTQMVPDVVNNVATAGSEQVPKVADKFSVVIDWLKELWDKIDIKGWAHGVGGSSSEAVQAAIYFGAGFAVGFLFNKYFKFFFSCLFVSLLFILILEYNKVLMIDWKALNVLLGFEATADIGVMLNAIFDWVRENIIVSVAGFVGFLIGYKLG